ncbi:MAG: DsrE family protein [Bacteroidales bacterium]|nr:DsrE family protein [Bacteroidales bacterium]
MTGNSPDNTGSNDTLKAENVVQDGVFLHISHGTDDPHRLLMGLSMAKRMADDKDVLVYLDIEAVKVLTNDAAPIAMEPFGSHLEIIQGLLDAGVTVMACPSCMKVAGIDPEKLIPGIQLAEKEAFFGFTQGRILSVSY